METLIVFSVAILLTVGVVAAWIVREKKRVAAWREVSDRLGLVFDGKRISGTLNDVEVRVFVETRGDGNDRSTYTVCHAYLDVDGIPEGLHLVPENFMLKLGKAVGMQDIQLDLPGIDEQLMVRARDEHAVREWAQRADVSRALADLTAMGAFNFRVVDSRLCLDRRGTVTDAGYLESRLSTITTFARALSGKGSGALLDDGHW